MSNISAEQTVALLRELMPSAPQDVFSQEALDWYADVVGTLNAHNPHGAGFHLASLRAAMVSAPDSELGRARRQRAAAEFMSALRVELRRLQLTTNMFTTRTIPAGQVHSYFEEVRGIIQSASAEILFSDPYINPEFVSSYLPQVAPAVKVRLLTSEQQAGALAPALKLFRAQHGRVIDLRTLPPKTLHDRHLVIDGRDVYQSGASFKDGARNADTAINQVVDAGAATIAAIEANWQRGTPVP